jgi:spore germination protein YaaH
MKKCWRWLSALSLSAVVVLFPLLPTANAADKTSKYRVYQNDNLLMEFSDYRQAENYARQYAHSHVEEIGTRRWLWDNFPRYRVYQYGVTLPEWEFARLDKAIEEAKKWSHASIRDLQSTGWVWNNYPRYRVYQGEITLDEWEFTTLEAAQAEARRWSNSHIIELNTNRWVWDNISEAQKNELRSQPPVYQVYQHQYTREDWKFAYLEDAVNEALKWANSTVVNMASGQVVYENLKKYQVYQNGNLLDSFVGIDEAADYARLWAHSSIVLNGQTIWSNYPYYQVFQNDRMIGDFHTIPEALAYAVQYSNASIRTLDGDKIWDNFRKLLYWGWNGIADPAKIKEQIAITAGLDVTSPPWFVLADANGNLKDSSDANLAAWLKSQGLAVHPLVSNQFDMKLTSQFLANPAARQKFVQSLVDRAHKLGVDGLNIDFESLAGSDRAAFTAFMRELADYAHGKNLTVSVDLPRGSVAWNEKTAFDHEKLAGIVDYIVTMAYDQYYRGSTSAGSVSGLPWAEGGIREFLSYGIPRDKLILGIPLYVRVWKLDQNGKPVDSTAVYYKDIPSLIATKSTRSTWDETFGQYRIEYDEGGFRHVFWLEDDSTIESRIALAKKYDLAGVAFWRLGYDTAGLWQQIIQQK